MKIPRQQARMYKLLRQDLIQHLLFGMFVYLVVFGFVLFHAWLQGMVEWNGVIVYEREALGLMIFESLFFSLSMGVPVYLNLYFVYSGRIQRRLAPRLLNKAKYRGWFFYLFLFFSVLNAALFAIPLTILFDRVLNILYPAYYENLVVILLLILSTSGAKMAKEAIERNRYIERKERQEQIHRRKLAEQQLQFIKRQIRPHFLFNTLANLQILAKQKSDQLPELMARLSRLLRYLLYETNETLVSLDQELEFLRSYVELERLQLSPGVDFRFEVRKADRGGRIAPMLLLVLIENCFKHYNKGGPGARSIHIRICADIDGVITMHTANTFKPNARNEVGYHPADGGLGLDSLQEKLRLVYNDRFRLHTGIEDNLFFTALELPQL